MKTRSLFFLIVFNSVTYSQSEESKNEEYIAKSAQATSDAPKKPTEKKLLISTPCATTPEQKNKVIEQKTVETVVEKEIPKKVNQPLIITATQNAPEPPSNLIMTTTSQSDA